MNISLQTSLQLSTDTETTYGFVDLGQEDWKSSNNTATKSDIIDFLDATLYGGAIPDICKAEDGVRYTKEVYAYPSPSSLPFNFGITYGIATPGVREYVPQEETIFFSLADKAEVEYPPISNITLTPIAGSKFYDSEGNQVTTPTTETDGKVITLSKKVYGSMKARYTTCRVTYSLSIPVREDDPENRFQTVFYVWWDGGVNLEAISPPTNADTDYENGLTCSQRNLGDSSVLGGDKFSPPEGYPVEEKITIDYCTQEQRS